MNISLPLELAGFVREKVEAGLYSSASEVVRESLRHLVHCGAGGTRYGVEDLSLIHI